MAADPRRAPVKGRRNFFLIHLLSAAICLSTSFTGTHMAAFAKEKSRGVRLLDPGEEMTPSPGPATGGAVSGSMPLETVRIAISDGDARHLSGLVPRDAPFEIVKPSANPDLVWDPVSHKVSSGRETIAYGIDSSDLASVIDRTAALRRLKQWPAEKSQRLRLLSGSSPLRGLDRIEIEATEIAGRALVLFAITGDGTVQILYPLGSDPHIVPNSPFRLAMQMREPFGSDAIIAVSSTQALDVFEQSLKQISHYRSAGEALKLIKALVPDDARLGLLTLTTTP